MQLRKNKPVLCVLVLLACVAGKVQAERPFESAINGLYSSESIAGDIEALSSSGESLTKAADRLIARGSIILEQAHSHLGSTDAPIQQKQSLIIILGIIADKRSIGPIINVAGSHHEEAGLTISALNSLLNYKRDKEIEEYVYRVLKNSKNPRVIHDALVYLAKYPAEQDRKWADLYSAPEYDLKARSAALYLGGHLGLESYKDKIMDALEQRNKSSSEGLMLMGLAALTTPKEFNVLVKKDGISLQRENIDIARLSYYLRKGNEGQQRHAAKQILHHGYRFLKKDAINLLIDNGDADALSHAWLNNDKAVRNMVLRSGLIITIDEDGAAFADKADFVEGKKPQTGDSESESREAFFRSIFLTLKNNDKDKFRSLALINNLEYMKQLLTIAPSYKYGIGGLKKSKEQLDKSRKVILDSWDTVYKQGLENNIDWAETRYVVSNKNSGRDHRNTKFLIGYNGYYYRIDVPEVANMEGKLRLLSQIVWVGSNMKARELEMWSQLAADNNDKVAAKELKLLSERTISGEKPVLKMRASYNSAVDQYRLYELMKVSESQKEKAEAISWLKRAADNNLPIAQYELSEELIAEWLKTKNPETLKEANKYLILSTEQNHVRALKKIADHYSRGSSGFDFDLDKAILHYQALLRLDTESLGPYESKWQTFIENNVRARLAEVEEKKAQIQKRNLKVMTEVALMQMDNHTIASKRNGLAALIELAESNYPEAQYQLGNIYVKGNEVAEKDIDNAVRLWQQAADQEHMKATEALAYGYIDGKHGISRDLKNGLSLADKLAQYHSSNLAYAGSEKYAARIWQVKACDLEIEIARKKDPSYILPRVKTGRCKGL